MKRASIVFITLICQLVFSCFNNGKEEQEERIEKIAFSTGPSSVRHVELLGNGKVYLAGEKFNGVENNQLLQTGQFQSYYEGEMNKTYFERVGSELLNILRSNDQSNKHEIGQDWFCVEIKFRSGETLKRNIRSNPRVRKLFDQVGSSFQDLNLQKINNSHYFGLASCVFPPLPSTEEIEEIDIKN